MNFHIYFFFRYNIVTMIYSGKRRLEIRCYGLGQAVLVDIHIGRICWHCWYHFASSHAV